ncbi:MAG: permease-like cell division protein FtsX [Rhodanobacteraceae bacterium]
MKPAADKHTGKKRRSSLAAWGRHCQWALRASIERLSGRPLGTAMTMLVLGLALAMPLALWLLLGNAQRLVGTLGDTRAISVFMQTDVDAASARSTAEQLRRRSDVAAVSLKSPDQGMTELAAMQGFGTLVDSLPYNPLPWVLLVQPNAQGGTRSALALAEQLRAMPGVDLVQDEAGWRKRMQALLSLGKRSFALLAALLVLAMLMVVGQTVRQDIRSRADEIAVLQMAGASTRFVRRPYLYAGALYGFGAGLVAVLLIGLIEWLLAGPSQALLSSYGGRLLLQGLGLDLLLVVPVLAAALGWAGARLVST